MAVTPIRGFLLLLAVGVLAGRHGARLASGLEPGMQLLYESEGQAQPPWWIDSLTLGAPLRDGFECAVVHLRRGPEPAAAEESRLCLANDTLYRWDGKRAEWSISRPVGPGMSWTSQRGNGDVVQYQTGDAGQETISGRAVPVVKTTVTTSDSTGRPKQRLRERYAISLITATGGVFETADSARAGEWLVQRRFELREIRPRR
jgi:hypothetical protein